MKTILLMGDVVRIAKAEAEPKWQRLFTAGTVKHRPDFPKGGIKFDATLLGAMERNFKALKAATGHELQLNFHHLGGMGIQANAPLESTLAAGWIQDVELRDDGLYALVKWTDRARKYIAAEELKYLSPEFATEYTNPDTGKKQGPTLLGAALTNTPFLKDLPRVAAADTAETATQGAPHMEKAKLCSLLGLSADVSDDDMEKAVKECADAAKKVAPAVTKMSDLEGATIKLNEKVAALEKEKAALLSEKLAGEVKLFVDGLVKTGKVTPAIRENVEKLGLAGGVEAIKFFENAASSVQMGTVGVTGETTTDPEAEKKAAQAKYFGRVAEHQAKGINFSEANSLTRAELTKEYTLVFGS